MTNVSIIFLLVFFFGFVITVILIYKNRKKFWAKGDGSYSADGLFLPDDAAADHSYSSASHDGPDSGGGDS